MLIYFVRHGIRRDMVDKSWKKTASRPHDVPLAKEGIEQCIKLGKYLKANEQINHILSSPFMRAVQTAHLIADQLDMKVLIEPVFCEYLRAKWFPAGRPDFLSLEELARHYHTVDPTFISATRLKFPEGSKDITRRTRKGTAKVLRKWGTGCLIVGHGISVKRAAQSLVGYTMKIGRSCAGLTKLEKIGDKWHVKLNNFRKY